MKQEEPIAHYILEKGEGLSLVLKENNILRISCDKGGTLADLMFLDYHPGFTLDKLNRFVLQEGDLLYNSSEEPVMKVLSLQSSALTNILYPPCSRKLYKEYYGISKDGCLEILSEVLGINSTNVFGTINLFMDLTIDEKNYAFKVRTSKAKAGDYNEFKALKNVKTAISACPCEKKVCMSSRGRIIVEIYNDVLP